MIIIAAAVFVMMLRWKVQMGTINDDSFLFTTILNPSVFFTVAAFFMGLLHVSSIVVVMFGLAMFFEGKMREAFISFFVTIPGLVVGYQVTIYNFIMGYTLLKSSLGIGSDEILYLYIMGAPGGI